MLKKKEKVEIYGENMRKLSKTEAHILMLNIFDLLKPYAKKNNKSALVFIDYGKGCFAI